MGLGSSGFATSALTLTFCNVHRPGADCLRVRLRACSTGLDPAGLYGPMNGSEVIGRGGGEEGHQSNHSLGALPTSTGFLGGTGNGGAFQLPNGLTRQDSFGMSLAGGAMHGGMHPMLRQDSFARLNANLAFSGGPVGSPGNAIGNAALAEQSLASTGKAHALEASVSSVFGGSGANGELGISAGLGSTPPFGQESASQLSNTSQLSHNSQLSNNLASHVMGERGAESGLWRAMNQALRQDSSASLSIGGGAIGFQQQRSLLAPPPSCLTPCRGPLYISTYTCIHHSMQDKMMC